MQKILVVFIILVLTLPALTQMKENTKIPSFSHIGIRPNSNVLLGFLNPDRLSMNHTFSMSYMSMGNAGGMMVNSYMNTINYQISDPLFLRMNLGVMNVPYNSFNNPALGNTQFFGGAELFYQPTENSMIKLGIQVRPGYNGPGYYGPGYYNGYGW